MSDWSSDCCCSDLGCGIARQWREFDGGLAFFEHGVPLHGEYPSDAPAVARFPRAEREPGDAYVIQSGVRCKPSPQERPMGATCFRAIARIAPMGRPCDAFRRRFTKIGRASCRERVCQYGEVSG